MNYSEAYNKIIDAYFKDEIQPFDSEFCFCGTLSPNWYWRDQPLKFEYPYTINEYVEMEQALFSKMENVVSIKESGYVHGLTTKIATYTEDELFSGMSAALDVLKSIHEKRGEIIDEQPTKFVKRELAPTE